MRFFLLVFAGSLAGCAHTTVVSCLEPAAIDVAGMSRVTVVPFAGTRGHEFSALLSARLWENNFYDVVDRSEFSPEFQLVGHQAAPSLEELLAAAQEADLDGMILGRVVEYRCDEQWVSSQVLSPTNPMDFSIGSEIASLTRPSTSDAVLREASVVIHFQFIDVETGEVRASRQVEHRYVEQAEDHAAGAVSEEVILGQLMEQCLSEIVDTVAPHEASCEMNLAKCDFWVKGAREANRGLKLANKGDWSGAEAAWQQAVETNPNNHAAHFNLSIAAARQQDYDAAEMHALSALKIEHAGCYTQGLETIRQRRSACTKANDQREARAVSAAETIWQ